MRMPKMSLKDPGTLFHLAGAGLFLYALLADLARAVAASDLLPFLRLDDWRFGGAAEFDARLPWYLGAAALILLPGIARGIRSLFAAPSLVARLLFYGGLVGILAAVATPNFNRARHQAFRDMGLSVGGAKDIESFRENVRAGALPQETDITYEGLFYDYAFDTPEPAARLERFPLPGARAPLFTPSFASAVSADPFTGERETFLSVGLRSSLDAGTFDRKRLNLVVCLDISGSMSASFDNYYYGGRFDGGRATPEEREERVSDKLTLACRALVSMLGHLRDDDRLGVVLFDHRAHLAKPLRAVGSTDLNALRGHLRALRPQGGTNMEEGYRLAASLLLPCAEEDAERVENRIVFLTDAMPNLWGTGRSARGEEPPSGPEDLAAMGRRNAARRIHTTWIGIGLDFNTELVEELTKMRGANYFSVHSAGDFRRRLDREFACMVTPLVFDLSLSLEGKGLSLEGIYGSPEADRSSGEVLRVNTLFPSPTDEEGTKGGLVLLHLRRDDPAREVSGRFKVRYLDRAGRESVADLPFTLPAASAERHDGDAVRKGIALARFVTLAKEWLAGEPRDGKPAGLSRFERGASPLTVRPEMRARFAAFAEWFAREAEAVGDPAMARELEIARRLAAPETARR